MILRFQNMILPFTNWNRDSKNDFSLCMYILCHVW